jgi:uncharacterized membrane protein YphA (DoxX/SURF4 family)
MSYSLIIPSIFITLLFFLSGFHKIKDFINVTKGFVNKTHLPFTLGKFIIAYVIILEILAPLIITAYAYNYNPTLLPYARFSIIALIIFTILATILYHFPPNKNNYYSFMSNLSTIGGLMLLYMTM